MTIEISTLAQLVAAAYCNVWIDNRVLAPQGCKLRWMLQAVAKATKRVGDRQERA